MWTAGIIWHKFTEIRDRSGCSALFKVEGRKAGTERETNDSRARSGDGVNDEGVGNRNTISAVK
jgi:hypothetical protein